MLLRSEPEGADLTRKFEGCLSDYFPFSLKQNGILIIRKASLLCLAVDVEILRRFDLDLHPLGIITPLADIDIDKDSLPLSCQKTIEREIFIPFYNFFCKFIYRSSTRVLFFIQKKRDNNSICTPFPFVFGRMFLLFYQISFESRKIFYIS